MGRDHNMGTSVAWLAGAGVKGGVAHGESDPWSWRAAEGVAAVVQNTVQVSGRVTTERSTGAADRVVLVGWEERSDPLRGNKEFRPFDAGASRGLPTLSVPK